MNPLFRTTFWILSVTAAIAGQSANPGSPQPGARLILAPSEPLTEPRFPRSTATDPKKEVPTAAKGTKPGIRPAILNLKPAGDPIYLGGESSDPGTEEQWHTYSRPKVEPFSRNGEGIALNGYDVVSYLSGHAERGRQEFSAEHGGTIWRFATVEHRDLFTKDPERYLPEYGGFCAYSVGKGYPATADPSVFTIDDGKLYLFFDQAVRAVWQQERKRLIARADQNWQKLHR